MKKRLFYVASAASVAAATYLGIADGKWKSLGSRLGIKYPEVLAQNNVLPIEICYKTGPGLTGAQVFNIGHPDDLDILLKHDHALSYDTKHRVAYWVFEDIMPHKIQTRDTTGWVKWGWYKDSSVKPEFRTSWWDYTWAGYERAHLASPRNHTDTKKSFIDTYIMSNIVPMDPPFYTQMWTKLEGRIRLLSSKYEHIYVLAGPLYLPKFNKDTSRKELTTRCIGDKKIVVPTHLYKIVICQDMKGKLVYYAFKFLNKKVPVTDLNEFMVPIDEIEKDYGMRLLKDEVRDQMTPGGKII